MVVWASRPRNTRQYWPEAENNRKYKMVQQQKILAEADAGNTSGPHDVGRPSATPHHVVMHHVASRMYFMFFLVRIPFGDHPLKLERYRED